MSDQSKPYRVVSETHVNQWDSQLQRAVSGWEVQAVWLATNTVIPVFVPDDRDLVAGVDLLVRAQGAQLDKLRA